MLIYFVNLSHICAFVLFIAEYCNNNIKRIYSGVCYFTFLKKKEKVTADALNLLQMVANICYTIRLHYWSVMTYLVNQCMIQVVISISCGWQSSSENNNPNTQPVLATNDFFFSFGERSLLTLSCSPSQLGCENYFSLHFPRSNAQQEHCSTLNWASSPKRFEVCAI